MVSHCAEDNIEIPPLDLQKPLSPGSGHLSHLVSGPLPLSYSTQLLQCPNIFLTSRTLHRLFFLSHFLLHQLLLTLHNSELAVTASEWSAMILLVLLVLYSFTILYRFPHGINHKTY